jgi:hypothetical protein
MRLYPKKLSSVRELKRERHKLRLQLKEYKEQGIFAGGTKKSSAKGAKKDVISSIADFFFNSPFASLALNLGSSAVKSRVGKKAGKGIFNIGKELVGGYAKWKALEVGYRWARRFVKSKKEEHEENKSKK